MSEKIPYKIYLSESEMPKDWYNVRADMKNKPAPLLNPATHEPMKAEELEQVFCKELVEQERRPPDSDSGGDSGILQDVPAGTIGTCLLFGEKAGYTGEDLLQI